MNDLIGQRFGKLTVIERAEDYIDPRGHHRKNWRCRCKCGNEIVVRADHLTMGATKTCRRCNGKGDLYSVWAGMKSRCYNPKSEKYRIYGGRGITVCKEWEDFVAFKAWAYDTGYDPYAPFGKCTLDRVNPYGNYEPTNCRWVTMKTQQNNKRRI